MLSSHNLGIITEKIIENNETNRLQQEGLKHSDQETIIVKLQKIIGRVKTMDDAIIQVEVKMFKKNYFAMFTQSEFEPDRLKKLIQARIQNNTAQKIIFEHFLSKLVGFLVIVKKKETILTNFQMKIKQSIIVVNKPSPFNIESMVRRAFQNKNQAQGSTAKFRNDCFVYKTFESEQALVDTLPKRAIDLVNQFVEKHPILLPSVIPSQHDNTNYYFDISDTIFHGPYVLNHHVQIEMQQDDKPLFYVWWILVEPDIPDWIFINFMGNEVGVVLGIGDYSIKFYDIRDGQYHDNIEYDITLEGKIEFN